VADEQIERLAHAVQKAASSGGKLVGVTGYSHGEGCTTILLAVAMRLVELGQKTLLFDGDLVKPDLAEQLALANELGWRDVTAGSVPVENVITQSDSESVALLPYRGRATPADAPEPSEQSIAALLRRIRAHYDVVLVDLGSALTFGGALAEELAEQIDSVFAVQNVQTTSPDQLALLRKRLRRIGLQESGVIENFVDDGAA
jgi:Mrp family chromosome partitioning ATPase